MAKLNIRIESTIWPFTPLKGDGNIGTMSLGKTLKEWSYTKNALKRKWP